MLARAGLCRSELRALRWDDVVEVPRWADPRLRDAVAERPADETAWALRVEHSKRGRSRLVPLARPVVAALEAWKATSASARARARAPRPRVFVSITRAREQDGVPLAPGAIGNIVARYAADADLPPGLRTPHGLRHTFCTAIAERRAWTSWPSWQATPTSEPPSATSPSPPPAPQRHRGRLRQRHLRWRLGRELTQAVARQAR